jgi:phosphatidylserine/phosphatidylglycerophosphate/cardiolipin synthase-like enzyme
LVQAYGFTSPDIVKALADAKRRGVVVRVILDAGALSQKKEAIAATTLATAGVPVLVDDAHAIAHNKVMVIDSATVITGSYNFTRSAQERNAENLLVIRDPSLAGRYGTNWNRHAGHSLPYRATLAQEADEEDALSGGRRGRRTR